MTGPRLSQVCGVPAKTLLMALSTLRFDESGQFTADLTPQQAQALSRAHHALVREMEVHQGLSDEDFGALIWGELARRTLIATGAHPHNYDKRM